LTYIKNCARVDNMILIKQKFVSREDLRSNPLVTYLFGDNLAKQGLGGQAKEMRGEPNAFGVPTKKAPCMDKKCFFTDEKFDENRAAIDKALYHADLHARTLGNGVVVIPSAGLGTGLAKLEEQAPLTFTYLKRALYNMFSTVKNR
jgi:hypothetical protein